MVWHSLLRYSWCSKYFIHSFERRRFTVAERAATNSLISYKHAKLSWIDVGFRENCESGYCICRIIPIICFVQFPRTSPKTYIVATTTTNFYLFRYACKVFYFSCVRCVNNVLTGSEFSKYIWEVTVFHFANKKQPFLVFFYYLKLSISNGRSAVVYVRNGKSGKGNFLCKLLFF